MFPHGFNLGYTFLVGRHMMFVCPSMGDVGSDPLVKFMSVEDEGRAAFAWVIWFLYYVPQSQCNIMRPFFGAPGLCTVWL